MSERSSDRMIFRLTMTGILTAMVTVCTMILPIPIPMTTGYVNLGDGILFLSVMLVGWKYGAFAGGVGAALADLLLGSAAWAPWTLVIKAGMAMIAGKMMDIGGEHKSKLSVPVSGWLGMLVATVFMAGGYYVAEGVLYGNWVAPAIGLPWNLVQGTVGTVVACLLTHALKKTSARRYFCH